MKQNNNTTNSSIEYTTEILNKNNINDEDQEILYTVDYNNVSTALMDNIGDNDLGINASVPIEQAYYGEEMAYNDQPMSTPPMPIPSMSFPPSMPTPPMPTPPIPTPPMPTPPMPTPPITPFSSPKHNLETEKMMYEKFKPIDSFYLSKKKVKEMCQEKKINLSDSEINNVYRYFYDEKLNELDLNSYLNLISQNRLFDKYNLLDIKANEIPIINTLRPIPTPIPTPAPTPAPIPNATPAPTFIPIPDSNINTPKFNAHSVGGNLPNASSIFPPTYNSTLSKEKNDSVEIVNKIPFDYNFDYGRMKDIFKLTLLEEEQKKYHLDAQLQKMKEYMDKRLSLTENIFQTKSLHNDFEKSRFNDDDFTSRFNDQLNKFLFNAKNVSNPRINDNNNGYNNVNASINVPPVNTPVNVSPINVPPVNTQVNAPLYKEKQNVKYISDEEYVKIRDLINRLNLLPNNVEQNNVEKKNVEKQENIETNTSVNAPLYKEKQNVKYISDEEYVKIRDLINKLNLLPNNVEQNNVEKKNVEQNNVEKKNVEQNNVEKKNVEKQENIETNAPITFPPIESANVSLPPIESVDVSRPIVEEQIENVGSFSSPNFINSNNEEVGNNVIYQPKELQPYISDNLDNNSNDFTLTLPSSDDNFEFANNQFQDNQFVDNQFGDNQFSNNQFGDNQFSNNQFGDNQFSNNQFANNLDINFDNEWDSDANYIYDKLSESLNDISLIKDIVKNKVDKNLENDLDKSIELFENVRN